MIEYGLLKELRQVLFRNHFNLQKYSSLPEVAGIKEPAIRKQFPSSMCKLVQSKAI